MNVQELARRYLDAIERSDRAALEAILLVPDGAVQDPGDEMRARVAVFLETKNGKIVSQRNYDCFEPF